jgi:GntR family transcriptional regulator/MocR family aminotransferase
MALHVNLVGRKDLSGEIYRQVRRAILDGQLRPGDNLTPSRELARALAVSRGTVIAAYERLMSEGFVTSRPGAGTFVSERVTPVATRSKHRPTGVLRPRSVWASIALPRTFDHPPRFDFGTGLPDASLFPHRTWRRLVARALRSRRAAEGIYGHSAGDAELRAAIARHIGVSRGVQVSADDIVITNGTQQALDLLARVLLSAGDTIAVEDPGYTPLVRLFKSLGVRVVGVPVDRDGLVVEALPRIASVVYVTPSHQYPLGVPMTLPRRQALLAWAERHGVAIIEDDYDSEFRFADRPLEPLQTLDASGRVIYVGSFSKTLSPALRLGFLAAPPSLRDALRRAKFVSDWHTATPAQIALAALIEGGGFARHVRRVNGVYRERHDLLVHAITRDFDEHLELIPSSTGLHIAALARTASVARIAAAARRALDVGVFFQQLSSFAVTEPARAGIMLGYGAIATKQIREGLRRLRKCLDAH